MFALSFPLLISSGLAFSGTGASSIASSTPAPSAEPKEAEASTLEAAPAIFLGDFDGDGLPDVYAIYADRDDRLFRNSGDGSFTDVTLAAGLAGNSGSRSAQWTDYDRDGFLDLYVAADRAERRLFRNRGDRAFEDMTEAAGLETFGKEVSAAWLDYDGDGYPDLAIRTSGGDHLLHNTSEGWFEPVQLGIPVALPSELEYARQADAAAGSKGIGNETKALPSAAEQDAKKQDSGLDARTERGVRPALPIPGPWSPDPTANGPGLPLSVDLTPAACFPRIRDRVPPYDCIQASSIPTLDMLYPITENLFVSVAGDVGMGTTSPAAKLDVAGTARVSGFQLPTDAAAGRVLVSDSNGVGTWQSVVDQWVDTTGDTMTGTLILDPGIDEALDVSAGSIYKGGEPFIHTHGGIGSTALGRDALASVTEDGFRNTASGDGALSSNTLGDNNTAHGYQALTFNIDGSGNTGIGRQALYSNTTGSANTAVGNQALYSNTTGIRNTAIGEWALRSNLNGERNTAIGYRALRYNTTGWDNTATGFQALLYNESGMENTGTGEQALRGNTTGSKNTASGFRALSSNLTGDRNTANGVEAMMSNTSGRRNAAVGYRALRDNSEGSFNTACGDFALRINTTGSRNIALGYYAGSSLTTGNDNIAIGNDGVVGDERTTRIGTKDTHTRAFVAGIHGVTTDVADAIPVFVDSLGQLGTAPSSRRFKKDIGDMGNATERLLELRPVVFHYKQEQEVESGEVPLEYGLIAEEVAEIFPDLVVYDEEGLPFTVKYHLLSSMLLNELKKQGHELEGLRARLETQSVAYALELEKLRSALEERLAAVEAHTSLTTLREAVAAGSR